MKIVLFDIDGTLIKAGGAGLRGLNLAVKDMCGVDDICSKFPLQGATDKENFRTAHIRASGRKPTARQVREMERRYVKYLPKEVEKSVRSKNYFKMKGVEKLLNALSKRKDVMIGLGTGNLKEGAFIKLKPSGFMKYFAFGGYGCDSRIRSRVLMKAVGRARKLLKIGISPGDVYVIGDTHKDIEAAKDAGYHSAAVTGGFGDAGLLQRSGPELLAKDFSDLAPWFVWLGLVKDPKGITRGTYICPDSPIEHAHYGRTGLNRGQRPISPISDTKLRK
ncbi:MAG: HAD family hydrolase [Elusimicrobia bacterium]|nr:HAD family hydrolase [Elusimicrobiota bacterium]